MHKRGTRDGLAADLHAVVEDPEALLKATSAGVADELDRQRKRLTRKPREHALQDPAFLPGILS